MNFKYVFMLNLFRMMMVIIMNIMTAVGATICTFLPLLLFNAFIMDQIIVGLRFVLEVLLQGPRPLITTGRS